MHTLLVIVAGLLLAAVFSLFGWLWGETVPSIAFAARAFIPAWLILAGINMWVGVGRAGYSVADELPIMALVFAVPAAAAFIFALVAAR